MTTRSFGKPVRRTEDLRLITGQGSFTDDAGSDALSLVMVRSPYANARVVSIDVSEAEQLDGVTAVLTYEDLPDRLAEPLPLLIPHPSLSEPRTQHILAKDRVRYVGQAVVAIFAADRYIGEDAAERVIIEYESKVAVVGIDGALGTNLVHHDVPRNVAADHSEHVGDVASALAEAPHVLELDFEMERSLGSALEGRASHATWDRHSRKLQIQNATQTPTSVRFAVANILEIPDEQVEVFAIDVGGGFGTKVIHPWPEDILTAWGAMNYDRAVKFTEDRVEHFISSSHERGQRHHVKVGFNTEGQILGLDVDFVHDNGAYTPYGMIAPLITATQLPGPYKLPNYRVRFRSVYTNTVQVTPYRGAARPHAVFTMERTMDRIASFLGIDRSEVRQRNFIQPDEFPYDLGMIFQDGRPAIYDSGDYPEMLNKALAMIEWDSFAERRSQAPPGKRRGIGVACYVEGTGLGPYEGGHVRVETGGKIQVSTGLASSGQGHHTVFAQIVADELGVPFEDVEVVTGDTRRFKYAVGTFASRAAVTSGNAVAEAARLVKKKAIALAADALEANPEDLEIVDGQVQVKGTPVRAIPLSQVAVLANPLRYSFSEAAKAATQFAGTTSFDEPPIKPGEDPGLEATGWYSPVRATFASGTHAVEVEVDLITSEVEILRYCVVHDCGRIINPLIVEGQIHGGVAQGIAGALYEKLAYDEDGNLQNASFMDFLMPYCTEIPKIEIDHLETPSPLNPLGIKGAGEAGVIPVSAVIASAIEDAEGFEINQMPLFPSELHSMRLASGRQPA
ncbi:MAG TPA: xanthine dehydrogenase family protein molybdopterin-binding subunit [Acidimicrobiia bacterium]|jgi:CO/xanthine dehydrogenase Mo-binding subunit|nr:xanthine dehydrogenase family protein molybdopterin-binding subunit [Acidimicrobiia bacterium]